MATKTTTPAAKKSTPKATRAPQTPKEPLKIGLFVGREWSWPPAFIEESVGLPPREVVNFDFLYADRRST